MNDLVNKLTMTSLEIAELTGSSHNDVMRDIEKALSELGIDHLKFQEGYLDSDNQQRKMYRLPRYECDVFIYRYSVKYRVAVVNRWQDLEEKEIKVLSPSEMLLQSAQLMVNLEKEQSELRQKPTQEDKRLDALVKRLDKIEQIVGIN